MRLLSKILSFLLLASVCLAGDSQDLRVYPPQGIMTFRGLDEKSSPTSVQDGRSSEAQNVKFTLTGGLSKRAGIKLVNGVLDIPDVAFQAVTGLYYTKLSSGTAYRIATVGNRFYYDNSGTWTQVSGFSATYAQNNQFVFTTALDNIIFTNDTDAPQLWTGSGNISNVSFTGLSNAITKAKCVAWFKNYLIFGNTVENSVNRKTRIRWSNVGLINTWSDDDYIDIDTLSGQEIQGFGILYDNLYIFMTDSIYKVSLVGGNDLFAISKVVEGTGCIAKNSIQNITLNNTTNGLIFLSKDKTINFFDGTNVVDASILIEDTMDGLLASRLPYAVSAADTNDYYLAVTTGNTATSNNLLLDFQFSNGDWSKHTQIDANAMASVLDSDGLLQVYYGNYHSFVYQMDNTSLNNDISGHTGTFEAVSVYTTATASGLQIIYDNEASFTATGAIVRITGGSAIGEERVIAACTSTGIVVTTAFDTTPTSTSTYSIGDIDAIYTTKWFDLGNPTRRKQFGELYLWAEEQGNMSITANYAQDFGSYLEAQSVSLLGGGGVWGTAVWGTDTWGGQDAVLRQIKLKGSGRFIRYRFTEPDINETFNLYGYSNVFWDGDVQ